MADLAHDRLERLFDLHLDGALSAADEAALAALLADPGARRRWRAMTVLAGGLMTELRAAGDGQPVAVKARPWWTLAAAAVILVAVGVWWATRVRSNVTASRGPALDAAVLARAVHPLEPAAPPVPAPPPAEVLVVWALETDGARPAILTGGRFARCPPGAGVRTCVAADRFSRRFRDVHGLQVIERTQGLFPYADDLVLTFDYWVGESTSPSEPIVTSYFHQQARPPGAGYQHAGPVAIRRGQWTHVALPLSAFRPQMNAGPPVPGLHVDAFDITGRYPNEDIIFIANVRVVRAAR